MEQVVREMGRGHYRKFTESEIDKMVRLWNSGVTQKEIARLYNTTPKTVGKYLKERMAAYESAID